MTGKSHLATGVASVVVLADTIFITTNKYSMFTDTAVKIKDFLLDNQSMPMWLFLVVSAILFLLGLLLPDIDHPYSMLGRIIHIPIEHRTWTHYIWLPATLCVVGIFYRFVFWLSIGILLHDLWDKPSASGLNMLYPIIKSKRKRHLKLYHTSEASEYVVVGIFCCLSFVYTFCVLQSVYHFVNIAF